MKLINKLIPLASCLAIGATVAPVSLTACANSEFVELKDDYLPTITKADGSSYEYQLTKDEALSVYVNAINENPQRFIDDCNWTFAQALNAIASNPYIASLSTTNKYLIPDGGVDSSTTSPETSTLEYAKQKVSNVVMGKTTFLYPDYTEEEWVETTVPTLSFDLEREQKFTYNTYKTVSSTNVSSKVEGISKIVFKVSNLPILFNDETRITSTEFTGDAAEAHIGRYLMYPTFWNRLTNVIPSYWTLGVDSHSLRWMDDPWSISYDYTIDDKETYSYNDTTTTESWTDNSSGSFDTYEKLLALYRSDAETFYQLGNFSVKSYYLSDIAVKEGE